MASSNKHWPSMFKSKPCNTAHYHWRPYDLNSSSFMSAAYHGTPYSPAVPGCEERTPEPKPRWNPRPEQIRILEAIFNSGMVNPPRDEIRKIRVQLQEYGQVGDANVFYWFQNRKSRSKHKQRQQQNISKSKQHHTPTTTPISNCATTTIPTSSSSSSDKSSPISSAEKALSICSTTMIDLINSPTASVNQPFLPTPNEFLAEPFFFPVYQNTGGPSAASAAALTQGFCFPDVPIVADHHDTGNGTSFLLSELMLMNNDSVKKAEHEKIKLQQLLCDTVATAPSSTANTIFTSSLAVPSPMDHNLQAGAGIGEVGPTKSTVFINDVGFAVGSGPFNVKQAFGYDAVLLQSSGQPVPTNEWGITLHPLCHGEFYYLLRDFSPSPDNRTIHLM